MTTSIEVGGATIHTEDAQIRLSEIGGATVQTCVTSPPSGMSADWLNRVHSGDCREVMKSWPSGVADACITDPPYGDTSLEWDRRCEGWMAEVARVLKPAASVWVFGSMRYLASGAKIPIRRVRE